MEYAMTQAVHDMDIKLAQEFGSKTTTIGIESPVFEDSTITEVDQ